MFGLRIGFFLGFLGGAIVSSLLGKPEDAETSGTPNEQPADAGPQGLLNKARRHLRDARHAAREAAEAKEREMLRDFDEAVSRER